MNKLLWMVLGAFLYNQYAAPKLRAAMDDRNALLAMLSPEQRAQLLEGLATASSAAQKVITGG